MADIITDIMQKEYNRHRITDNHITGIAYACNRYRKKQNNII